MNLIDSSLLKFLFVLLIIHCFSGTYSSQNAYAQQETSTLRIMAITEDGGTPAIAATVFLTIPEGDTLRAGATDVHGFLEFSNLPPDDYTIQIRYIGYQNYIATVSLNPGQTLVHRPELMVSMEQLDEVVVRVARGSVQRQAGRQVVTPEDLSRVPSPGPGSDLTMYLQSLPSVVTTGDRGGELFIRGGTPSQNLVQLENMPIVRPFHISNLFSAFSQDVISSVEVYAGGFGPEYTGATSAVLDVNLRQGNMRNYQSQAAISPYIASMQFEGPIIRDRHSLLIKGRYSLIDRFGPRITGEDEIPLEFYDVIGKYSINMESIVCNITGLYTNDSGKINPVRNVNLTWTNTALGVRCLGYSEIFDNAIDFTIGYTGYSSTETGIDNLGRESDVKKGYMRMDNRGHLNTLPINYGFKLEFVQYNAILDEPFAQTEGRDVRFIGLSAHLDELTVNLSTYFNMDWQVNSNLNIRPGVASQMGLTDLRPTFEPRVRATFNPGGNQDIEINAAAGRYVQLFEAINDERDAGTVFYVYKPVKSDDPYPTALHGILGYRQQLNRWFGFNVEGFIKSQRDIPVARWTREPGNTLETGLLKSKTIGLDTQIELTVGKLFVSAGYGLSEVTYEAPSSELVAWIDRPVFKYNPAHDRRHQLNMIASLSLKDYSFNVNWQYSSSSPFTRLFAIELALLNIPYQHPLEERGRAMTLFSEPYDGRLPSFYRLDVSLSRTFELTNSFHVETEIGAINTFDTVNVFYFDVNTMQQVNQLPFIPYFAITTKI